MSKYDILDIKKIVDLKLTKKIYLNNVIIDIVNYKAWSLIESNKVIEKID